MYIFADLPWKQLHKSGWVCLQDESKILEWLGVFNWRVQTVCRRKEEKMSCEQSCVWCLSKVSGNEFVTEYRGLWVGTLNCWTVEPWNKFIFLDDNFHSLKPSGPKHNIMLLCLWKNVAALCWSKERYLINEYLEFGFMQSLSGTYLLPYHKKIYISKHHQSTLLSYLWSYCACAWQTGLPSINTVRIKPSDWVEVRWWCAGQREWSHSPAVSCLVSLLLFVPNK